MKLEQKQWPYYRNYEIKTDGVEINFKIEQGNWIQTIKFEEIEFEEQIHNKQPSPIKAGFIFSLVFNICLVVLLLGKKVIDIDAPMSYQTISIISIILVVFGKFYYKKEIVKILVGRKNLAFWYGNKHKNNVDLFIFELKEAKRNFLEINI